jgi:hypothetical protein
MAEIIVPRRRLRVGSHIRVRRPGYYHHGTYEGRWRVIHYAGKSSDLIKIGPIARTTLEAFADKSEIEVVEYDEALSREEIISRAKSRLHEDGYHILWNNCEHFATWCMTGNSESKQVRAFVLGGLLGLQIHNLIEE